MNLYESAGAAERYAYLAENLVSLHAAPDLAWLTGRFEFLGEKALGAALSVLALPDERGVYRASSTTAPRPAVTRDLWDELDINSLSSNQALRDAFAQAERRADALTLPLHEVFADRRTDAGADAVIVAPLLFNRELIGVGLFCVQRSPEVEHLANILAVHAATAIYQLRQREEGRRLHSVDPRLWVPDEHFLLAQLRREVSRARRYGRELGLAILWIENEPDIRFRLGDFFTDHLLRRVGGQLLATVRDSDVLGALGGSYAVIHTETGLDGTQLSADRLRVIVTDMAAQKFPEAPLLDVRVRCAAFPANGSTVEDLLAHLDQERQREAA